MNAEETDDVALAAPDRVKGRISRQGGKPRRPLSLLTRGAHHHRDGGGVGEEGLHRSARLLELGVAELPVESKGSTGMAPFAMGQREWRPGFTSGCAGAACALEAGCRGQ